MFTQFFMKSQLFVVSEQENAEIWINGKNTGKQTPATVVVPLARNFTLELKYFAHETYRKTLFCGHEKSFHFGNLQKQPLRLVPDFYETEGKINGVNWESLSRTPEFAQ